MAVTSVLNLPSCLSQSTLGDVLGGLHRQRLSGVLQVIVGEHTHEIELQNGLLVRVTLAHDSKCLGAALRSRVPDADQFERGLGVALARSKDERPLGERLLATRVASTRSVREALQELHQSRLNRLFSVSHARLRFRIIHRPTVSGLVWGPALFLHHRRRYRDRAKPVPHLSAELQHAFRTLGLKPGVGLASVKAAFRRFAAEVHPDKCAFLGSAAVEVATRRFREGAHSYRLVMDYLSRG